MEAADVAAYKRFHTDVVGILPQVQSLTTCVVIARPRTSGRERRNCMPDDGAALDRLLSAIEEAVSPPIREGVRGVWCGAQRPGVDAISLG